MLRADDQTSSRVGDGTIKIMQEYDCMRVPSVQIIVCYCNVSRKCNCNFPVIILDAATKSINFELFNRMNNEWIINNIYF